MRQYNWSDCRIQITPLIWCLYAVVCQPGPLQCQINIIGGSLPLCWQTALSHLSLEIWCRRKIYQDIRISENILFGFVSILTSYLLYIKPCQAGLLQSENQHNWSQRITSPSLIILSSSILREITTYPNKVGTQTKMFTKNANLRNCLLKESSQIKPQTEEHSQWSRMGKLLPSIYKTV